MKKLILLLLLATSLLPILTHADYVRGYTKKNGTYVPGYNRSSADSNPYNNYSYPGNTNPYTGKTATGNSSTYLNNYYSQPINSNSFSNPPASLLQPAPSPAFNYTIPNYSPSPFPEPILNRPNVTLPTPYTSTSKVYGYVMTSPISCDYFVASSDKGYALLEWYGGRIPSRADLVFGNFDSYGFKTLYTGVSKARTRVWVEDYMLSMQESVELYADKCNL